MIAVDKEPFHEDIPKVVVDREKMRGYVENEKDFVVPEGSFHGRYVKTEMGSSDERRYKAANLHHWIVLFVATRIEAGGVESMKASR